MAVPLFTADINNSLVICIIMKVVVVMMICLFEGDGHATFMFPSFIVCINITNLQLAP